MHARLITLAADCLESRGMAVVFNNFLALGTLDLPHFKAWRIPLPVRFFLLSILQNIPEKRVRELARISKDIKGSLRKSEYFAKFYGIFPIFADLSKIITKFSSFFAKDIAILCDFCYNIRIWIWGADFLCFWTSLNPFFHTIIL